MREFKQPSSSITFSSNSGVCHGSTSLSPEKIESRMRPAIRAGTFNHRLPVRAMCSINHLSDLINFSLSILSQPIQGGSADIYGGEAGFEFLATRWLTGFANYSYQEIGQTFTADRSTWRAQIQMECRTSRGMGQWSQWRNRLPSCRSRDLSANIRHLSQFAPFGVTRAR